MSLPRIGITMGDPAGIGPEIILKALSKKELQRICDLTILGDRGLLLKLSEEHSIPYTRRGDEFFSFYGSDRPVRLLNLSSISLKRLTYGKPEKEQMNATITYIKEGAKMALSGEIDAIVTAPINKEALKKVGFDFPGHTEFLAHLTKTKDFVMMMVGGGLRVSLVTIHLSLKDAIETLTKEDVSRTIMLTDNALKIYFSIEKPSIGVAGLNPHAGEGGIFGMEEREILMPAINKVRQHGIDAIGPLPPDTIFYRSLKGGFDAVVAMYHDQGLIPVKLLAFERAVNVTLGLPIIRTSVDHGTAYDIAGRWQADPSSLIEAISLATQMAKAKTGDDLKCP